MVQVVAEAEAVAEEEDLAAHHLVSGHATKLASNL